MQLGSFASRANAEKLVHQLKAQGFVGLRLARAAREPVALPRARGTAWPIAAPPSAALAKLQGAGAFGELVPRRPELASMLTMRFDGTASRCAPVE